MSRRPLAPALQKLIAFRLRKPGIIEIPRYFYRYYQISDALPSIDNAKRS